MQQLLAQLGISQVTWPQTTNQGVLAADLPAQSAGGRHQSLSCCRRQLRSCGGLGLAFLLHDAVEEDEAEGKQAKHQRVFFRFGDDLAVDSDLYRATAACHKIATQ